MKIRDLILGLACFLMGAAMASNFSVKAQNEGNANGAWEITHGSFGEQSFYVIKHNRVTGETLILDAARGSVGDGWEILPVNDKTVKKH